MEEEDTLQQTVEKLQKRQAEMVEEITKLQRENIELQKEQARLISVLTPEQLVQYYNLKRDK